MDETQTLLVLVEYQTRKQESRKRSQDQLRRETGEKPRPTHPLLSDGKSGATPPTTMPRTLPVFRKCFSHILATVSLRSHRDIVRAPNFVRQTEDRILGRCGSFRYLSHSCTESYIKIACRVRLRITVKNNPRIQ